MTPLNLTVDQLLATEMNLGEDTSRNFTECHRRLYMNLLLTEKYITLKNFSEAQNRIVQCYDEYKTLKSIGSEYESSKESSYDFLKIVHLEIRLRDAKCEIGVGLMSNLTHFREAIENSRGDEDLKQEIIKLQIKNLLEMKRNEDEPYDVTTILSLFDLLPLDKSRALVQIELFVKNIHHNLPELSFLTQSQVVTVVSICSEADLKRREECLHHVLKASWAMTDVEKEECLTSMLFLSGTDLIKLSRYIVSGSSLQN